MTDEDDTAPPAVPGERASRVPVARKTIVNKLWRAARRQLEAHEAHLDDLPKGAAASEADAKALAVLARTVRELMAMDAAAAPQGGKTTDDLSPAAGLRHAAELRKELARRLEALAASEADRADQAAHPGAERRSS